MHGIHYSKLKKTNEKTIYIGGVYLNSKHRLTYRKSTSSDGTLWKKISAETLMSLLCGEKRTEGGGK